MIVALLPPAIMFIAAGRTDWWEAWIMVGVLALITKKRATGCCQVYGEGKEIASIPHDRGPGAAHRNTLSAN